MSFVTIKTAREMMLEEQLAEANLNNNELRRQIENRNTVYFRQKEQLAEAINLVKRGLHFSGHYSDCTQEHDDEPCSCGADEFEHNATMFLYQKTSKE